MRVELDGCHCGSAKGTIWGVACSGGSDQGAIGEDAQFAIVTDGAAVRLPLELAVDVEAELLRGPLGIREMLWRFEVAVTAALSDSVLRLAASGRPSQRELTLGTLVGSFALETPGILASFRCCWAYCSNAESDGSLSVRKLLRPLLFLRSRSSLSGLAVVEAEPWWSLR